MGWSMVNFSASKMHLPHHRRTNMFPWSPVATYSITCKTNHLWHWLVGATAAGPNPSAQTIKTSQRHVRVPTYPTRTNIWLLSLYCFVGIPTGQLPCGSKWVQYPHLFIATACYRCTDHVIMCWKLRDSPKGSGITFAGLLFGLAATPQKPLQNLGRLLVVQWCRALWKFMTCFFQPPQTHQLSVHCGTVSAYRLKNQKRLTLTLADLLSGIVRIACLCVNWNLWWWSWWWWWDLEPYYC